MRIIECVQGTDEWKAARAGKITASRMSDVLNYLKKGGDSQARASYRIELIAERLTGLATDCYISPEMKWGTEQEPFARAAYEVQTGNFLDQVGFVLHPTMDYFGSSPDGVGRKIGGAEFKSPKSTTHLNWIEAGVVPEEHVPQMQSNMLCCERDWWDFISYDPRMIDEGLQLFTVRLQRDESKIRDIEAEARKIEDEINEQIERLKRGR